MRQEQLPVAFHMQSCLFRAENTLWYLSLPGPPKFAFQPRLLDTKSRPDLYPTLEERVKRLSNTGAHGARVRSFVSRDLVKTVKHDR